MAPSDANREALPNRIGDRYRVEKLLGTGGMATVYLVLDEVTGRHVALKRLQPQVPTRAPDEANDASERSNDAEPEPLFGEAEETQAAPMLPAATTHAGQLFEREFDTLSQLVHPRIIEVYDYHRDAFGPYYTMELLDGGDLRERSPLHWREACKVLCDVCSAMSLLHSRRLVHRDLTPLNIRCTRSGNAKLFDFGSMSPFGRSRHVVGTPPFVAPEALHGEIVDAQTDLFALGATAYYALTGRHAYPARQLLALPDAWLHPPPPPSKHVDDIPPALDELVLWLLQLAPSARPPSAAEVMERLSAIAGFDLQEELVVRQAYLSTPILVGREQALDRVRRRVHGATVAGGGALVVSAEPGMGRTRLLDACVLEARLLGAIVLRADEREGSARWGVAGALMRQLLAQAPELALPAAHQHAASLVHLLPEVDPKPGPVGAEAGAAGEQAFRPRAQMALRDVMFEVAEHRALIVVVDDVHRIDEPSAAFLALIAHESRRRRMLLIASVERSDHVRSVSALSWLLHAGESIRLKQLSAEETAQLVRSLFGETPNVRLVADRIHGASAGNPAAIMQIARQLVATGRAHYAAGTWTLPSQIEVAELALPSNEKLDPHVRESALELARAIAVCEGAHLTWSECLTLTEHRDARRLISELDELVATDILSLHAERYFVRGPGVRAALLRGLPPDLARRLHARAAEFYVSRGGQPYRVALHRWRAGQVERALDIVLAELRFQRTAGAQDNDPAVQFDYVQALPCGWQEMCRALIEACATLGRPVRDRLDLQLTFLAYTSVTAGYEPELLQQVMAQLRADCGLDLFDAQDESTPASARLAKALAACQARYAAAPESERGLPLAEAIPMLVDVLVRAISMAARALDHRMLVSMPSLVPLLPLSPALAVVQQSIDCTRDLLSGRVLSALSGMHDLLEQLAAAGGVPGMSDTNTRLMTLALQWSSGIVEANWGDPAALARAETIEPNPLFAVNAWRVRALFSLFQGDLEGAERCRVQTELLQIQNSPPQLFEGSHSWQMALGYFAAHDLLRTKQCISDLEAMARQFEPWKPTVSFARGAYQTLRGDGASGLAEFERALRQLEIGTHLAWPACAGGVLCALNVQGRFDETVRRGYVMLDQMRRADQSDLEFFVRLPLAHAEIERGRLTAAAGMLAAVIESHEGPGRRNVYLGRAYELRAWLALRAKDAPEFQRALALCQQQYAPPKNPVLRGKLEQLRRAAREAGVLREPLTIERRREVDGADAGSMVATVLSSCEETKERVERALLLLTRHSRCTGGFLYTLRTEGPALVARRGDCEPLPQLDALVNRFVVEQAGPRELTRSQYLTTTGAEPRASWRAPDGTLFVPMLLAHRGELGPCITGVAVMWMTREVNYRVPTRLLTALSRTLHESGDTMTLVDRPDWHVN